MEETTQGRGRPSLFNKQLADMICARVGAGESLRSVAKDPSMPASETITRWLREEDKLEFRLQYRQAYEDNLMVEAYSMREMVDEVEPTVGAIAKLREQIAHRKWELKIQFPKKYGDKPEPAEAAPQENLTGLSDEELDAYVALRAKIEKND